MKATYWEKIIVSSERTKQIQAKPHATSSTLSSHHLLAPFPLEPNFWGLPILLDSALHPLLPACYPHHFIKRLCQVTTSSLFQNPVVSVQPTSDNKHLAIPTTPPFWKALSSLDFSYAILNCFSLPSFRLLFLWVPQMSSEVGRPLNSPLLCSEFSLHVYVQLSGEGFHRFTRNHLTKKSFKNGCFLSSRDVEGKPWDYDLPATKRRRCFKQKTVIHNVKCC